MYLTGVHLQNIACFEDLEIDFTLGEKFDDANWIVFVGENGTGKSTIMQMMGVVCLGLGGLYIVDVGVDWTQSLRYKSNARGEVKVVSGEKTYDVAFQTMPLLSPRAMSWGGDNPGENIFITGYGVSRGFGKANFTWSVELNKLDSSEPPYRFTSLIGDGSALTNVSAWLAGLYNSSIHPDKTKQDIGQWEKAKECMIEILPEISDLRVTKEQKVLVKQGEIEIPIERLSDGFRGTYSWIGDLIRRLFDAFPDKDNPLEQEGIVLVDEIDLHLHPKWQRKIVQDCRALFPNIQFLVTTHSPFIVQDLKETDRVVILENNGAGQPVTARVEKGTFADWSADQIFSEHFGLRDGTRGEEYINDSHRLDELLAAKARGTITTDEKKELTRLKSKIKSVRLGSTEEEEKALRLADERIEEMRRKRKELQELKRETSLLVKR